MATWRRLVGAFALVALPMAACTGPASESPGPTAAPSGSRPSSSPVATTTPSATSSPDWSPPTQEISFSSDRYGYAVELPQGWYVRGEGAGPWRPIYLSYVGAGTDSFEEDYPGRGTAADFPGVTFGLYVSSAAADGASLGAWTDRLALTVRRSSSCKEEPGREQLTIDDEPAEILVYDRTDCTHDHHVLLVGVLHGDAGYAITWLARRGEADARRAEFERILETFRFTE